MNYFSGRFRIRIFNKEKKKRRKKGGEKKAISFSFPFERSLYSFLTAAERAHIKITGLHCAPANTYTHAHMHTVAGTYLFTDAIKK